MSRLDMRDESLLDTGVDLLVYSGKYLLLLAEIHPGLEMKLSLGLPRFPLSDHAENLDQLIDKADFDSADVLAINELIGMIETTFEALWPLADKSSTPADRFDLAMQLWRQAALAVGIIAKLEPRMVAKFIQEEVLEIRKGGA